MPRYTNRRTTRTHPYVLRNRTVAITGQTPPSTPRRARLPQTTLSAPIRPGLPGFWIPYTPSTPSSSSGGRSSEQAQSENNASPQQFLDIAEGDENVIHPRLSLLGMPGEIRNIIYDFAFGKWSNTQAPSGLAPLLTCRGMYADAGQLAFRNAWFHLNNRYWDHNPTRINRRQRTIRAALTAGRQDSVRRVSVVGFGPPLNSVNEFHASIDQVEYRVTVPITDPEELLNPLLMAGWGIHYRNQILGLVMDVGSHTRTGRRFRSLTIAFPGNEWSHFESYVGPAVESGTIALNQRHTYRLPDPQRSRHELLENNRLLLHFDAAEEGYSDFDVYFERIHQRWRRLVQAQCQFFRHSSRGGQVMA